MLTADPASAPLEPPSRASLRTAVRDELREIVHDLARSRELLAELTRRDLRVRYKQSMIGVTWAFLMPLVIIFAGWLVRAAFAALSGQSVDGIALAGVAVKSVGWAFFVGALSFGTASLTQNLALLTKVYFPREMLPLAAILTQVVDTTVGAVALLLILPLIGVGPTLALLWLPVLAVMLLLLTTSLTLLLACLNVFFRDARHLVQLIVSFGIFFTPVFFDASALGPRAARLLMLNPLAPVLEGMRLAAVNGHNLAMPLIAANGDVIWTPWLLTYAGVWSLVGILGSSVIFHRAEFRFAEFV